MDLVLSTYFRAASDPVAEPTTGHAVDRLGVIALAVEHGIGPGLHLDEENHSLVGVLGAGRNTAFFLMPWSGQAPCINTVSAISLL